MRNPPPQQVGEGVDEVTQRAAQAVQSPDDQHVPVPQVVQCVSQARPFGLGAGGNIPVELLATRLVQGVFLQVERLLTSGNAGIANVIH